MTIVILFGILSLYDIYHITYIICLTYLYINIDTHYANNRNISLTLFKQSPLIISSYYGTSNNTNIKVDNDKIDNNKIINNIINNKYKNKINKNDIEMMDDDGELIDSLVHPSAPKILDEYENMERGKNVKIYHTEVGVINDYHMSKSKFN